MIKPMIELLQYIIHGYELVILASIICSWLRPARTHPLVQAIQMLTEPVYSQVRRCFPFVPFAPIDWSPMICLIGLAGLERGLLFLI